MEAGMVQADGSTSAGCDLMDPSVHADPYPTYRWLRERAPVYRMPGATLWVVSRHHDIERILHDHDTFYSDLGMKVPLMLMVMKDPPDHTRFRTTVHFAFTHRNIRHLGPRIAVHTENPARRPTRAHG